MHKFIKNEKDYKEVYDKVNEYFEFLKNTHIEICATSLFPVTYTNAFTQFIKRANLIDKTFKQSDIDRLFIATNFEEEEQDNNDDSALIRFEFIELMIRIAKEKYFDKGKAKTMAKTMAEAFTLIVERNLRLASRAEHWREWRLKELYQLGVQDLLDTNLDLIAKVYILVVTGMAQDVTKAIGKQLIDNNYNVTNRRVMT